MSKVYSVEEIKNLISELLVNSPVKKAILFGSYARGEATRESDIDIYIDSGGLLDGLNFFGIYEKMESILKKHVDLVEASDLDKSSALADSIAKDGIVVYEQRK